MRIRSAASTEARGRRARLGGGDLWRSPPSRKRNSQNFARSGLLLVGAGAALAAGDAGPVSNAWSGLELAQAHEHGQQWSGEHAPPTPAQQPSPEHQQRPPQTAQPPPEGQQPDRGDWYAQSPVFFRMCRPNEARGLLRELRLPEQLIQRKFAAPSFAYGAISPPPVRACSRRRAGSISASKPQATSESNELCRPQTQGESDDVECTAARGRPVRRRRCRRRRPARHKRPPPIRTIPIRHSHRQRHLPRLAGMAAA